jgi:hypothetical protein
MDVLILETYAPFAERIFLSFAHPGAVTTESNVAKVVWRAANDASGQLQFPAGCRRGGVGSVEINDDGANCGTTRVRDYRSQNFLALEVNLISDVSRLLR